jgi:hypothetical protein
MENDPYGRSGVSGVSGPRKWAEKMLLESRYYTYTVYLSIVSLCYDQIIRGISCSIFSNCFPTIFVLLFGAICVPRILWFLTTGCDYDLVAL